jgi:hypothetical protein
MSKWSKLNVRKIFSFFGSNLLTIWLVGILSATYITISVFTTGGLTEKGPLETLMKIGGSTIYGRAFMLLLLLNLFAKVLQHIVELFTLYGLAKPAEIDQEFIDQLRDKVNLTTARPIKEVADKLIKLLREKKFNISVVSSQDNKIKFWAIKPGLSQLRKTFFITGIFLLLLGFFTSLNLRQQEQINVGEGQNVTVSLETREDKKLTFRLDKIEPGMGRSILNVGRERGLVLSQSHLAKLSYPVDSFSNSAQVKIYPPTRVSGYYLHILKVGLAPRILIRGANNLFYDSYTMLDILPPGQNHQFQLTGFPYTFDIKLLPKKIIKKNGKIARLYDLQKPTYNLKVWLGPQLLLDKKIKSGQTVNLYGRKIIFADTKFWARLNIIKDAGLSIGLTGFILLGLGLLTTLFCWLGLYRKQLAVLVAEGENTMVSIGGDFEFYKNKNTQNFHKLALELESKIK